MEPKGRASRTRKLTVNVAVGLLVPSLTVTVLGPGAEEDGTVNVHPDATLPDVSVTHVVGMPVVEPSYVTVRLCEATRSEPVMVTDVPTAPDAGLREIDGTAGTPMTIGVPLSTETGITPQIESPEKLRGAAGVQGPEGGW